MIITTLSMPMGKIAAPRAELTRTATVLQEYCSAMAALNLEQLFTLHLFRVRLPPCCTALRGAEALLPMPGRLLKYGVTLWAVSDALRLDWRRRRGRGCWDRVTLAIGLDGIDGYTQRRGNLSEAGSGCPETCDLFSLLLGHAFSPFQKAYWRSAFWR